MSYTEDLLFYIVEIIYMIYCSPFWGLINILSFLTELEAHHLRVILN